MKVEHFISNVLEMPLTLFHLKGPGEPVAMSFPTWKLLKLVIPTLRRIGQSGEFSREERATIAGFLNYCEVLVKERS